MSPTSICISVLSTLSNAVTAAVPKQLKIQRSTARIPPSDSVVLSTHKQVTAGVVQLCWSTSAGFVVPPGRLMRMDFVVHRVKQMLMEFVPPEYLNERQLGISSDGQG